ncbi:MAG: cell surface receptor IPT/TIG domain-containing protein [Candidatus Moranbacteria bacterium GW2011_GWE2_35_2-]|nr:MAG: cell surface receptor IPT/TIG domain-containing protein [Candidatus Moranbacteria bacterium GW2011_GWE2_35_2-]KKQ22854.1 MAG: cell surface receptor IPT/TIG domain-containing protein [Candidatus Moranbacteria bacterium GW2011_GWF2_37_11]KKQ28634.1 MAG: cell surface receptor IPT/TIG domain-containing protein [Candidatus Moranbacteria bacterium GW2011_GWD1_37_17]KKQ30915.1 MAG: cell surface receptor IPT/TIG domain-containing protein [Candidatus Moranbacteria bacterium GW2011_GWE1_37_24]KKQ
MKSILIALCLFFLFSSPAQSIEFEWPTKNSPILNDKQFTIHIGEYSRNYSEHLVVGGDLCRISIKNLPLKPDSANFISVSFSEKEVEIFSNEIIVLWRLEEKPDSDEDGLSDEFEKSLGTNPNMKDSDNDGIPDGEEYVTWGAKRSLLNFDENKDSITAANIIDPDSDNDGILDGKDSDIRRISRPFYIRDKLEKMETDLFISLPKKENLDTKYSGKEVSVTFFWTKNTDSDFAGYKIHYGIESKKYNIIIDVGKTKTPEQPKIEIIFKLVPGVDVYYFAATAYNADGFESGFSEEIAYSIKEKDSPKKEK